MPSKEEKIREFIRNNPSLSGNETLKELKGTELSIRKTNFFEIYRNEKNLPEPTQAKKERSVPIKFRKVKPTIRKPAVKKPTIRKPAVKKPTIQLKITEIPFEETKFGSMVRDSQRAHGISERKAIERVRILLKIPKRDYRKLNRKDRFILEQHGY